jgi:hypothetical protein
LAEILGRSGVFVLYGAYLNSHSLGRDVVIFFLRFFFTFRLLLVGCSYYFRLLERLRGTILDAVVSRLNLGRLYFVMKLFITG